MGFFSDLKEDLSQAVNEVAPEEAAKEQEAVKTEEETAVKDDVLPESKDFQVEDSFLGSQIAVEEEVPEETMNNHDMADTLESLLEQIDIQEQDVAAPEQEAAPEPKKQTTDLSFSGTGRSVSDEVAVVTAGMKVKGDLVSDGSMNVIGTIEGNIDIMGKLNVTGSIVGNSKATEIYAENANISGEVRSDGSVKIGQSSVIIGNIFASSAVIAGAVKGDIDVKGPVVLDTSAIVMGNIKSRSVQINNGAVIEGMCSQCYADVNPTSFFEDLKKKS